MKKVLSFLLISIFLPFFILAQPQTINTKILSNDTSSLNIVVQTPNQSIYVSGEIRRSNGDGYLAKTDKLGNIEWEKTFDKGKNEYISHLEANDNEAIVFVSSMDDNYTSSIIHLDSKGKIISEKTTPLNCLLTHPVIKLANGERWAGLRTVQLKDSVKEHFSGIAKLNANDEIVFQKIVKSDSFDFQQVVIIPHKNDAGFSLACPYRRKNIKYGDYKDYWKISKQGIYLSDYNATGDEIAHYQTPSIANQMKMIATSDEHLLVAGTVQVFLEKSDDTELDVKIQKLTTTGKIVWEKMLHLDHGDYPIDIKELPNHHYIISVYTSGTWVTKANFSSLYELDENGETLWSKVMRNDEVIEDVIQITDNEYIGVGYQKPNPEKSWHATGFPLNQAQICYFSKNACLWQKTYNTQGKPQPYTLINDDKNGFWAAGINFSGNYIFLSHFDSEGTHLWTEDAGHWKAAMEVPVSICALKEEQCLVMNNDDKLYLFDKFSNQVWRTEPAHLKAVGAVTLFPNKKQYLLAGSVWADYPQKDLWIGKTDEKGKLIAETTYDFKLPVEVWDAQPCKDGSFILAAEAGEIGSQLFQLIKLDKNGKLDWEKSYPVKEKGYARAVIETADSGFVIGGISFANQEKYKARIIKTNSKGEVEWEKSLVKSDNDVAAIEVITDKQGNIIVATTHKLNHYKGGQEIYVAKIDITGKLIWEKYIGGANSHELGGMTLTDDNQILIIGQASYEAHDDYSKIYLAKVRND